MIDLLGTFPSSGVRFPKVYKNNCYLQIDDRKQSVERIYLFDEKTFYSIVPTGLGHAEELICTSYKLAGFIVIKDFILIDPRLNNYLLYGEDKLNAIRLVGVHFGSVENIMNSKSSVLSTLCSFQAREKELTSLIPPLR